MTHDRPSILEDDVRERADHEHLEIMMMIIELLQQIGLNTYEAEAYYTSWPKVRLRAMNLGSVLRFLSPAAMKFLNA
jgi:hypothetical protein